MSTRYHDTITWRGITIPRFVHHDRYVYVLHARSKLHHAQHYTGFSSNISARILLHRAGQGAKLTAAFNRAGIAYDLALLIPVESCEEGHALERALKAKHNAARYCPICKGLPLDDLVLRRRGHPTQVQVQVKPSRPRRPMPVSRNQPFC